MGIEDLKASTLPEYPKYENPEDWPTRKGSDRTVIRFDWDEDASDIINWNNLILIYAEIRLRGSKHAPEASPYVLDISQEDLLDCLKQEYDVLRMEVIKVRRQAQLQKNFSEAI